MAQNKIHTVIFDLDGTLSDSAVLTAEAFKKVAPHFDLPLPTEEALHRATGYPNPEFYYILYPGYPKSKITEMGQMIEQEELRILPSAGDRLLFKGCRELLIELKEKGIRLNIASTGDRDHVFSILDITGIDGLFDTVSCHHPDKTEMLGKMTETGDKNGYLMVGDMKKDYEAARGNGILSVGACYGYCRRDISDFDLYIDEPLDLLEIIENHGGKNAPYDN